MKILPKDHSLQTGLKKQALWHIDPSFWSTKEIHSAAQNIFTALNFVAAILALILVIMGYAVHKYIIIISYFAALHITITIHNSTGIPPSVCPIISFNAVSILILCISL